MADGSTRTGAPGRREAACDQAVEHQRVGFAHDFAAFARCRRGERVMIASRREMAARALDQQRAGLADVRTGTIRRTDRRP